jgi:signal transduction histidine kinase
LGSGLPTALKVVVEGTSRNLHPILRDEVYRVAAEALRNAFRHAAAQNVEAEIHYYGKEIITEWHISNIARRASRNDSVERRSAWID